MLLTNLTKRPRNVDALRAGAMLYGDLGTSKAYVIGLALAIAGYSSFWLILAVSVLCILVGLNYIVICRCYPNGGGVYASVRHRSEVLSLIGAFFITADYLVTAALSGLSAFNYFNAPHPLLWTCVAILFIGLFNYFGPKLTGKQAFFVVVATITCLVILAIISIPHFKEAAAALQPLKGGLWTNWKNFVSIIVALSGVEAIANITGVMKLDPRSTLENPSVKRTASRAISWVIAEVAIFTSLFSFASLALKGMEFSKGDVLVGGVSIRDYMLRYLGETFVTELFGVHLGQIFAWIIGIAIGVLLLSAVNTAINGLIAVQYLLSQDGELHYSFQKLNRYGVPLIPLLLATVVPVLILVVIRDIPGLAELYAIGFVGAIATNLGATSTDRKLDIKKYERIFMFISFIILLAVEITLFIDKPKARLYVLSIVVAGLILRGLAKELRRRREVPRGFEEEILPPPSGERFAVLCLVKNPDGPALRYALRASERRNNPLYLLYVREQRILSETDLLRTWEEDPDASDVFNWAKENSDVKELYFCYSVSDSQANTVVQYAKEYQVNVLIVECFPTKAALFDLMQIRLIREIKKILPEDIQLIIIP